MEADPQRRLGSHKLPKPIGLLDRHLASIAGDPALGTKLCEHPVHRFSGEIQVFADFALAEG